MNAGTKVILKYRMLKRLSKIKEFLADCTSKEAVRRKVEDSHTKAMDQQVSLDMAVHLFLFRKKLNLILGKKVWFLATTH